MDLTYFNIDNGYVEGILRGYRLNFLKDEDYAKIKSLTSLEELWTFLQTEKGYPEMEGNEVTIQAIKNQMKLKLSKEIEYLEGNSMQDLYDFIQFIRVKYMLENVLMMIEGLKCGISSERLQASVDPLGDFKLLSAVELSNKLDLLYQTVLIDSPVGPYFYKYLEQKNMGNNDNKEGMKHFSDMQNYFKEETPELVRSSLNRIWIETFYEHCSTKLNETSRVNMEDILKLEADFQTIHVTYNPLDDSNEEEEANRNLLCPILGNLYPLYFYKLKKCGNIEDLKSVLKSFKLYSTVLQDIKEPSAMEGEGDKSLEDAMYRELAKAYSISFDEQSNMSNFYAYVMLKEQEIKNVVWMAEMISRNLDPNDIKWGKYVLPFDIPEN